MTTELKKQFFNTFGIEHEERYYNCKDNLEGKCGIKCPCECCDKSEEVYCYPQITDKQYLELIVLHNVYLETKLYSLEYKSLKEEILQDLIDEYRLKEIKKEDVSNDLKHQVQAIFIKEE